MFGLYINLNITLKNMLNYNKTWNVLEALYILFYIYYFNKI